MVSSVYPVVSKIDLTELFNAYQEIVRLRQEEDLSDFDNLPQRFIGGRKITRIPSSSADVVSADLEGDINYDASFLYILLDSAGTLVWRRVAISSF